MGTKNLNSATDLITFTRASGGTFLGSNGLIQTATNNVPRIEYDATGAVKGLLIEEARTNKYKKSSLTIANTDISTWGVSNKDWWVSSGIFTSFSNVPTPDGGSSSTRVYSTGAADWITTNQNATGICYNGQTKSIWARTVSGTGTVGLLSRYANAWSETSLTEEWQRFEVAVDTTGDSEEYFYLLDFRVGNLTEALIWGAQLEEGDFASSYIPTNGSEATRAADVATIVRSSFGHNEDASTFIVEFTPTFPSVDTNQTILHRNGSGYDFHIWSTSVNSMTAQFMNSASSPNFPITANQTCKIAVVVKHGEYLSVCADGGSISQNSVLSDTTLHTTTVVGWTNVDYKIGGDQLGHIKSIKYYPRRLTNAQLQELTT